MGDAQAAAPRRRRVAGTRATSASTSAKRRGPPASLEVSRDDAEAAPLAAKPSRRPKSAVVESAEAAAAAVKSVTARVRKTTASGTTASVKPSALVQRVYKAIAGELGKLEQQTGLKSQDRERASRALAQMVNALEKAVDMQRAIIKSTAKGGNAKNKEALAHAEDLRREIAERLARLNRKRPAGRGAE